MTISNPTDPKKQYGEKKPPLVQIPLVALAHASCAHYDGDLKYGWRNWRDSSVEARTYLNAAMRHLLLWTEGEEFTRDTNVNNLGAVIACCAILLDAQCNDALVDNRSKSTAACDVLYGLEPTIKHLQQMQDERTKLAST